MEPKSPLFAPPDPNDHGTSTESRRFRPKRTVEHE